MVVTPRQCGLIADWAERTPQIMDVRIFGSRVKGSARPGSDLDVAVRIAEGKDENALTTYLFERHGWSDELTGLIGLKVDLQWYDEESAPRVVAYCAEASILVFER